MHVYVLFLLILPIDFSCMIIIRIIKNDCNQMNKFLTTILLSLIFANTFSQGLTNELKNVNATKFKSLIEKEDGVLLDVRTAVEFNNYHIDKSIQMNYYAPNFREKVLELPKDKPIYIYCNVGNRSAIAGRFLMANGYDRVYNLQRGILEWHQSGYPMTVNNEFATSTENKMSVTDFSKFVNSGELVFFDFYAPWCAPCKQMMPMIDSLTIEYSGRINIIKVNIDASRNLMRELRIQSIPLLALFKDGELLFAHNGIISRQDLENLFEQHLNINE